MTYDLPAEIEIRADGPIRIVTLNRPDSLNATTMPCTAAWPACSRN